MTNTNATYYREITVDFPDYAAETVVFELDSYFAAAGSEGFPEKSYTLTLDGSGTGTQRLPTPDNTGDAAWSWTVLTPDANRYDGLTLAYGASLSLNDWLSAEQSTDTPNSLLDTFVQKAGDTMTGQLTFSGTDYAAINLISLTTAERDALTPAEGDLIYNETTTTVQVYQGGAWVSIGSGAGGISNVVEDTTPQLGGDLDAQGNDITDMGDITFKTGAQGGVLRTGTANADKFILAAYDVDNSTYRTVIELDAGNDVVMQLIADYLAMEDAADTTKHVEWDISGATTGTATTMIFVQTAARSITFPDETGTLALSGNVLPKNAGILSKTTTYELAAADNGKIIECSGTFSVNCPDGLDAGFQVAINNIGSGTITITADTTLTSKDSAVTLPNQYGMATVYHAGSNVWRLAGDIA